MKLSANARDFVSRMVRDSFARDLKEAEEKRDKVKAEWEEAYKSFEKDLKKTLEACEKSVLAIVKKHNLTWNNGCGPDHGAHVRAFYSSYSYSDMEDRAFKETGKDGIAYSVACGNVNDIVDKISKAVEKALFEIEVHGRRDTLNEIVADVIKSIKEEK